MKIHKLHLWSASCAVLALVAFGNSALAVNKCTGADGKISFQDAPCAGKGEALTVRPASGQGADTTAPNAAAPVKVQTEAQRIEALNDQSQRERRKLELEVLFVPNAQGDINRQRVRCDQEIKALQTKKLAANNNTAGAQWEISISSEMAAIATRCDTRSRELKDAFDAVKKECIALGGCK